jgi:hypothetical protein
MEEEAYRGRQGIDPLLGRKTRETAVLCWPWNDPMAVWADSKEGHSSGRRRTRRSQKKTKRRIASARPRAAPR